MNRVLSLSGCRRADFFYHFAEYFYPPSDAHLRMRSRLAIGQQQALRKLPARLCPKAALIYCLAGNGLLTVIIFHGRSIAPRGRSSARFQGSQGRSQCPPLQTPRASRRREKPRKCYCRPRRLRCKRIPGGTTCIRALNAALTRQEGQRRASSRFAIFQRSLSRNNKIIPLPPPASSAEGDISVPQLPARTPRRAPTALRREIGQEPRCLKGSPLFLLQSYNKNEQQSAALQRFNINVKASSAPLPYCSVAGLKDPPKIGDFKPEARISGKILEKQQWTLRVRMGQVRWQEGGEEERAGANWTVQQQNALVGLHNARGNKWVQIAHLLRKSDNEVKNRFHSKLRMGLRRMNKLIADDRLPAKPVKSNVISKIIQTAEDRYLPLPAPQATEAYELKNAVLRIAALPEEDLCGPDRDLIRSTVDRIAGFNKSYRKKCKAAPVRAVCCKYKGKEIKTLLRENEQSAFKDKLREREARRLESPSLSAELRSDPQEPVPSACGQEQAFIFFSHPCHPCLTFPSFPSFPSFYLACLPSAHLEPYARIPEAALALPLGLHASLS